MRFERPVIVANGAMRASYNLSFSYFKENNMYFRLSERHRVYSYEVVWEVLFALVNGQD